MIQKTYGTAWERGTVDTNVYERTKTDEGTNDKGTNDKKKVCRMKYTGWVFWATK